MKRAGWLLILALLAAQQGWPQAAGTHCIGNCAGASGGGLKGALASAPTCNAGAKGTQYTLTDALSVSDCTVGGGVDVNDCYCDGTAYVDADNASGGGAPTAATYITVSPDATLSGEFPLNSLGDGLLKHALGTPALAIAGTDYVVPAGNVATATALAANGANCAAGEAAAGVDASGVSEGCFTPAGGAGQANQIFTFTAQTNWIVTDDGLGADTANEAGGHACGHAGIVVKAFDGSLPAQWIEPNTETINATTFAVVLNFVSATTGSVVLNCSGGGTGADDQVASEVPFTPAGTIAATDVQAAIEEVATEASGTDDQTAAEVVFTPAGGIAAIEVQAAIEEVDAEKAAVSHAHAGTDITSGVVAPVVGGLGADATAFTANTGIYWNGTIFAEMAGVSWNAGLSKLTIPNIDVTTILNECVGCTGMTKTYGSTTSTARNTLQILSGDAASNAEPGCLTLRTSATTDGAELNVNLCPTADGRFQVGTGALPTADAGPYVTRTIAADVVALGTAEIASEACATVVTDTATGVVAATDVVSWSFVGSVNAVTGYVPVTEGGLRVAAYAGTDQIHIDVCNPSAAPITPGALSVAWRVQR